MKSPVLLALLASAALSAPILDEGRAYEDFPFPTGGPAARPDGAPAAVAVSFSLDFPSPVRAATLHLRSGGGWHSADLAKFNPDLASPVSLRIPVADFAPEGTPGKIEDASALRISAWMETPATGAIALASAAFAPAAEVGVVRATEATAPGETAFATKMAARAEALLAAAGIDCDVVGDDFDPGALRKFSALLLPYSPRLSPKAAAALSSYVRAGGKLLVFYNASRTLAEAMGVEAGPWERGQAPWTALELSADFGGGRRIPHYTENAIPPRPRRGVAAPAAPGAAGAPAPPPPPPPRGGVGADVAAWLVGADGRRTRTPALVVSPAGAWFAHVPPRAYPAAADLVAAIVTGDPARAARRREKLARLPKDKTVAAWLTSPAPRREGGWKKAAAELRALGVNTLFVHLQAADTPLPAGHGNLRDALAACRGNGIALHAWVTCLSLDGVPEDRRRRLQAEGHTCAGAPGWLDPEDAESRALVLPGLVALARQGVDGIHLDYVRTPDGVPQSEKKTRAVTEFVRAAAAALREAKPGVVLSAAVYPTPLSASHRNQDWPAWVDEGLVDFVSPMIYTPSPTSFRHQLEACTRRVPASKLLPGIGTGADESQVDAATADAEILLAADCRGIAFFALEDALLELLGK